MHHRLQDVWSPFAGTRFLTVVHKWGSCFIYFFLVEMEIHLEECKANTAKFPVFCKVSQCNFSSNFL